MGVGKGRNSNLMEFISDVFLLNGKKEGLSMLLFLSKIKDKACEEYKYLLQIEEAVYYDL